MAEPMIDLGLQSVDEKAAALIGDAAEQCNLPTGFSSISPTIYDTAWVAMVSKTVNGETRWRFPGCFDFVLRRQMADGGWGASASQEDGILNTMAALLALKLHADAPHYSGCSIPEDIGPRINKADSFLQRRLREWNVEDSVNIGFEVLIPSHLRLLQEHGFTYQFMGRSALMALNRKKLARFDPEILYGTTKTTLVHSLEAFVGIINFDKVSLHRRGGSMMGSPSSTAAFLMYSSSWYDDTEDFLSTVADVAQGIDCGGVPTVFPATIFMLCWATSTLLASGFSAEALGLANMQTIGDFLNQQLLTGNGLVGFAPTYLEDADDTAKAIISLNLLGRPAAPDAMVAAFEAHSHFITFPNERNPSFSTNCHVLMALLCVREPEKYSLQIKKVANFLCDLWYRGDNLDKWHTSPQYPRMLLAQGLVRLLSVWDAGGLGDLDENLVRHRIPVVLCQILSWTLRDLESAQTCEVTAYAVLILTSLSSLPWFEALEAQIASAIKTGRTNILAYMRHSLQPNCKWVGKVSYDSPYLCQVYCLAAIKAVPPPQAWGASAKSLAEISEVGLDNFAQFFSQLPIFSQEPNWKTKASLVEGYLFHPQLKRIRLEVYPRKDMEEDRYLEHTALAWAVANNCQDAPVSAALLWDMMVISMLNYQTDEYMEAVIERNLADDLDSVKRLVHNLCEQSNTSTMSENSILMQRNFQMNGSGSDDPKSVSASEIFSEVSQTLSKYTRYLKEHPSVQRASLTDRKHLARELRTFLLAHITQIEDNARFRAQKPATADRISTPYTDPRTSYFDWVQSTSANHTSCPVSFAFMACLVGGSAPRPGSDCFEGVQQKYLAQSLCRHLAAMCRQQNDYGSIARDRAEGNVNSVNFPEFHQPVMATDTDVDDDGRSGGANEEAKDVAIKAALLEIAAFERESWGLAMKKLKGVVQEKAWKALRLFVDVTEVYGQIYIARDISSRMR